MYMARNTGDSHGLCGINMLASYPIKTSPNPPPSPTPKPVKCNLFSWCSEGETCCCASNVLGICLKWTCCELNAAVCCKDHRHCCPSDYPICDSERNLCLKVSFFPSWFMTKSFVNLCDFSYSIIISELRLTWLQQTSNGTLAIQPKKNSDSGNSGGRSSLHNQYF